MKMTTIANFQDLTQSGGAAPNGPMGIHGEGITLSRLTPSQLLRKF
jgi:hypothetical protein